jgi:hypothetical protein
MRQYPWIIGSIVHGSLLAQSVAGAACTDEDGMMAAEDASPAPSSDAGTSDAPSTFPDGDATDQYADVDPRPLAVSCTGDPCVYELVAGRSSSVRARARAPSTAGGPTTTDSSEK